MCLLPEYHFMPWANSCFPNSLLRTELSNTFFLSLSHRIPLYVCRNTSSNNLVSLPPAVVLLKPTVSVFPSTFPIEFSTSVQLTCTTNSRYANVSWLWNGGPLRNSSRIQLSDNDWVLDIKDINRNDAGMYQCQVSNSVSDNISDITHIDVICEYLAVGIISVACPRSCCLSCLVTICSICTSHPVLSFLKVFFHSSFLSNLSDHSLCGLK